MGTDSDLRSLKRRLAPRLLAIDGVAGVGVPGGQLTVYLEADVPEVREAVRAAVEAEQAGATVEFRITGRFRPH